MWSKQDKQEATNQGISKGGSERADLVELQSNEAVEMSIESHPRGGIWWK